MIGPLPPPWPEDISVVWLLLFTAPPMNARFVAAI
jgi:hypothetical protein